MNRDKLTYVCVAAAVLALAGCAGTGTATRIDDRSLSSFMTPALRRFQSMEEFDAYRRQVRDFAKAHDVWAATRPVDERLLLAQNEPPACDPAVDECPGTYASPIAVTATRAPAKRTSITNNQEVDVDEGDIVKQYGRFLIVLQHGRLFSIDTGDRAGALRLVDRIDVYSSTDTGAWYDELLIHGNNLIVTGYNYEASASEIDVITIGTDGTLAFQVRYFIESDDYYSSQNYASRLVRGSLVVYTPLDIAAIEEGESLQIPRMRRWTAMEGFTEWAPLFDITDVYWPIQPTLLPTLHVLSVCQIQRDQAFGCKSRGVVGPTYREVYVSPEHIYLWLSSDSNYWAHGSEWPDTCPAEVDLYGHEPLRSAVFQLPIEDSGVRAVRTIGSPYDQFAFDERKDRLLALLVREPDGCFLDEQRPMLFADIPLTAFSTRAAKLADNLYHRAPIASGSDLQSRYTEDYVIYGSPEGYWKAYWGDQQYEPGELAAVPIARPSNATILHPSHSVERIEVIGKHAVIVGVRGSTDFSISSIRLDSSPRIADTQLLPDLLETEGRSHAFNALVDANGTGLFGLPTVYRNKIRHQHYSHNPPSDVQFFATDEQLSIAPLGELAGAPERSDGYECEVSCEDWYGNARPIFIDARIFALSGSELIEGTLRSRTVAEVGRLQLTGPPERR